MSVLMSAGLDVCARKREKCAEMNKMVLGAACCLLALAAWAATAAAEEGKDMFPPAKDLMNNIPADFPRFYFSGSEDDAQWLSRYLWYHFSTRLGYGPTLFNQEYLTTSDMWMGGAVHPGWPKPIQAIHRDCLSAIKMDPSGYVHTHQHFSHAHEGGWPFPMWTQAPGGPDGYTAGWHFQQDGPGWVWDSLRRQPDSPYARERAIEGWELVNVKSLGIVDNKWQLESTGSSPSIATPATVQMDAFCAPFLQLRWTRTGEPSQGVLPYVEWLRDGDTDFSPERRVPFGFDTGNPDYEAVTHTTHALIEMYCHPMWNGKIKRIRIALAPGESGVEFGIDSFFTCFDTRHTINNPIFILACWNYFRWTGDIEFLKSVVDKMRLALKYQQTEMGGLEYNRIHNTWVGHDGLPGFTVNPDGTKTLHYGRGVGNNYWDIMPFGWDDMYATAQYYAATLAMAEVEEALRQHLDWGAPGGNTAFEPETLRHHAARVKKAANTLFWNADAGRFLGCIDKDGKAHDYGFTFLNLDAIWYGIASDKHAERIMDWLSGKRTVDGDTSTGDDIYYWRFGPRATTKRNVEWYGWGWSAPESIPWGGQVQDGGAVLGFSFYDLWARLHVLGPDDAWQRLREMLAWEREVWAEGGYRPYYEGGKPGTTLQGGGTAGGVGIDAEFFESSLIPAIVVNGFLGLEPDAAALAIRPRLPQACPEMGISNILYRNVRLDIRAVDGTIEIAVKNPPAEPIRILLDGTWRRAATDERASVFTLAAPGRYLFVK